MSRLSRSEQAEPAQIDAAKRKLRESGLRATPARVAVLRLLARTKAPASHAEIADELADGGWDRATLYRNLIDLTRAGLVRRSDMGDHVWRFELIGPDAAEHEHPHFVCSECGIIECLPQAEIALRKTRGTPRAVRRRKVEVQIRGRCDVCL
jgi:Fur family transcriptional regulator, ferric uptake regulator